jgi:hypothetical protein
MFQGGIKVFINYIGKITSIMFFLCAVYINRTMALSEGYILGGAYAGRSTVLIDKNGDFVHIWKHDSIIDTLNGYSCYLLPNGNLLRTAQVITDKKLTGAMPWQGAINEIDPWGRLVWRYVLSNDTFTLHHDIKPLPNGNVLATSFMVQTKAHMIAAGVDTNLLRSGGNSRFMLSEKIIEIKPKLPEGGDIVWQWVMFDHVIPGEQAAAHPERISGSIVSSLYNQTQWVHLNGLDYCPSTDLIVFSSRVFSELFVIDHGTTMQEAAGHSGGNRGKGGDILYRWGKPSNYRASGGTTLDCLHCPTWIPPTSKGAGNILFFHNNEMGIRGSEVIEIGPPLDSSGNFLYTSGQAFGPAQPTWKFAPGDSFYSFAMSSAFRMEKGNTLAHEAYPQGNVMDTSACSMLWEISPEQKVLWKCSLKLRSGMEEGLMGGKQSYNVAKIMYYPENDSGVAKLFSRLKGNGIHAGTRPSSSIQKLPRMCFNRSAGRIDFFNVAGCKIRVFLLEGKQIASASPAQGCFNLSAQHLRKGVYLITVDSRAHGVVNDIITVL